jgi:IS5 family transposase
MPDIFDSLFELQDQRLMKLGHPLLELEHTIDWESFRPHLERIHHKMRKSNAGAKPKDVVMMFKGVIIQDLYGLSDDQLEFQLSDRRSFQQFLGLSNHQRPPDAKTFWAFKNQLSELKLTDSLFNEFSRQIEEAGYIARKGQIVDASIIPAPIQRNTRKENTQIKQGDIPEDWSDNKGRQKDTDARWTKKNNTNYYGYKNHIQIDNKNKLIRNYSVTPANVHDSQVFDELLDASNTSKDVWADSAYRSEEQETSLKVKGYRSKVQRKGKRNSPLTKRELKGNRTRSKVRSRVEHVFGAQSNLRVKSIRCIGVVRTTMAIGLMNLTYNMRRLCFLQRVSAP